MQTLKKHVIVAVAFLLVARRAVWALPNLTTLATFNGSNGAYPQANVIIDGAGNLYGTTEFGGIGWTGPSYYGTGGGTVFKVSAGNHALSTLVSFSNPSGSNPAGGLIFDSAGNLYGTTSASGIYYLGGTVFKIAAGNNALTTLASFSGSNGYSPGSSLLLDAQGNLYGAAAFGGPGNTGIEQSGYGSLFQVTAGNHALNVLGFFNGTNGINPEAPLISDAAGNLYGTTAWGGANGYGNIFEYSPKTHSISSLASFTSANGGTPTSGLVADSAGNLYGTTEYGGINGNGTVFEYSPISNAITDLVRFTGGNGSIPVSGLIADAAGDLFGTTVYGGSSGDGTVFEVAAGNHALTTLYTFSGLDGADPFGSLMADAAGNLYGTTRGDGTHNVGTVFELTGTGYVVPEPSSWSLLALGIPVLASGRRLRGGLVSVGHDKV